MPTCKPSPEAILLARYVMDMEMQYAMVGCPGLEAEIVEAARKVLKAGRDTTEAPTPEPADGD